LNHPILRNPFFSHDYALNNLNRLAVDSKEKAKEFSWKKIAEKTMEVYNGVIN
jgi:hypothetical protein